MNNTKKSIFWLLKHDGDVNATIQINQIENQTSEYDPTKRTPQGE